MHLPVARFVLRRTCHTHAAPAASQNRRLTQLPIDPLSDTVVGCVKRYKDVVGNNSPFCTKELGCTARRKTRRLAG